MVYEPREDSFLLAEQVERYARKSVLDMGTGSGILGKTALKSQKVTKVTFADIDYEAIMQCKKNIKDDRAKFIQTNFFENIEESFDLISFNAPYLPNDPQAVDIALDGGCEGWEVTADFLLQAKNHLNKDGIILLLVSSLTKINKVETLIKKNKYCFKIVARKKIDFEELFVYYLH